MCQGGVISDQNGNIYTVTESGELLHNRHANGDPRKQLIYPGGGRPISQGFYDVQYLIAWSASPGQQPDPSKSHLALIASDGRMFYNRVDNPQSATPGVALPPLRPNMGSLVREWGERIVRRIFCDETGHVYWITPSGELLEAQLTVTQNQATLDPPGGRLLAQGWTDLLYVFSAGPGAFFSVDFRGELRYHTIADVRQSQASQRAYRHVGLGLALCWDRPSVVLAAGRGGIYSITTEGDLCYTRYDPRLKSLVPSGYGAGVGCSWPPLDCQLPPLVEGYCWPLSASPGEIIEFKVSVTKQAAPTHAFVDCGVRYLRLRRVPERDPVDRDWWIDVSDHTPMSHPRPFKYHAEFQETGKEPWKTGCKWEHGFTLEIPTHGTWASGLYTAEICPKNEDPAKETGVCYVVFIVKPGAGQNKNALAVLSNSNTWNAYNCWGGKSKYHCYDGSGLPQQLSFERPSLPSCPSELQTRVCCHGHGSCHVRGMTGCAARAELWVLTWLEDNGYAFDLYADHDLDQGIEGISSGDWQYNALVLNTHPEYWTMDMYDNLVKYLSNGGSVIYLGGNGIYERVEYERDSGGRVMKVLQNATQDQLNNCKCNSARQKDLWRNLGRPESAVLGVGFINRLWHDAKTPYEIMKPRSRLFDGVGGDLIGRDGLHGPASQWEIDICDQSTPADATVLALAANDLGSPFGAHMVYRELDPVNKNFVFSVGSLGFGSSLIVDKDLQKVIENVLKEAGVVKNVLNVAGTVAKP